MSNKIKFVIQLIGGISIIIGILWYLATQFTSIDMKLNQVVSMDIPEIRNTLEKNSEGTDKIKTGMDDLTQKINNLGDQAASVNKIETNIDLLSRKIDEGVISEIDQLGRESERSVKEVEKVSQKIDYLSRQYVKFLKLSKDKIIVSIPPKWVDELPYRKGTIYAVGISATTKELNRAQQRAVEQARSNIAMMLERKTINAVGYVIESAGKNPPQSLEELSKQFKEQLTEAINELLVDSRVESYWVDPSGYVYALVSLPAEDNIEGSKLGILIETLRLTHLSITEALKQDFKKQLKLELSK